MILANKSYFYLTNIITFDQDQKVMDDDDGKRIEENEHRLQQLIDNLSKLDSELTKDIEDTRKLSKDLASERIMKPSVIDDQTSVESTQLTEQDQQKDRANTIHTRYRRLVGLYSGLL